MTVLWGMASYICLWFGIVLARQLLCKTFYSRLAYSPLCCVTPSLLPSLSSTSFDQWDSRVAAAAFFCEKACVTATFASGQAVAAEDELQQHCSTAGDSNFDTTPLFLQHPLSPYKGSSGPCGLLYQ